MIQNENHLYYQNTELQEYVSQYGIVIESWYPFGGRGHTSEHFGNEVIKELAEKYGKSSAQITGYKLNRENNAVVPCYSPGLICVRDVF